MPPAERRSPARSARAGATPWASTLTPNDHEVAHQHVASDTAISPKRSGPACPPAERVAVTTDVSASTGPRGGPKPSAAQLLHHASPARSTSTTRPEYRLSASARTPGAVGEGGQAHQPRQRQTTLPCSPLISPTA